MDLLHKLELKVLGWLKNVPHLPAGGQKWLGDNVWWIVLIGTIVTGITALVAFFGIFALISLYAAPSYAIPVYGGAALSLAIVSTIVAVVYSIISVILMALAIKPLQAKQKKGWVLLFAVWLLYVVYVFINAVLTLNAVSFIVSIIFGALFAAVSAYFLFEIHSQFSHTAKVAHASKTAKK